MLRSSRCIRKFKLESLNSNSGMQNPHRSLFEVRFRSMLAMFQAQAFQSADFHAINFCFSFFTSSLKCLEHPEIKCRFQRSPDAPLALGGASLSATVDCHDERVESCGEDLCTANRRFQSSKAALDSLEDSGISIQEGRRCVAE